MTTMRSHLVPFRWTGKIVTLIIWTFEPSWWDVLLMWKFSKNHRNHPLHHKDNVQLFKHVGRIHHDMFNVQECGPISLPALSSLHSHHQSRSPSTMMRGVMWIHRDRYFSRWVSYHPEHCLHHRKLFIWNNGSPGNQFQVEGKVRGGNQRLLAVL